MPTAEEKSRLIAQWRDAADDQSLRNLVLALLKDTDVQVRVDAAAALGRIDKPGVADALSRALNDPDKRVRQKAVESLGNLGGEKAVKALIGILQNRDLTARMIAAEELEGIELSGPERQIARVRGEAWDLQLAAATGLAKCADVNSMGPLLGWSKRLMISEVRELSANEKIELIRSILPGLFRALDGAQLFTVSKTLDATIQAASWEEDPDGTARWIEVERRNPLLDMFQGELERRKSDYMKSLNNRDTLFNAAEREDAQATANAYDTLFNLGSSGASGLPEAPSSGGGDAKDSMRFPVLNQGQIDQWKRGLMKNLQAQESLFDAPEKPAAKAAPMDAADAGRKRDEYIKTLGNKDTLFSDGASGGGAGSAAPSGGDAFAEEAPAPAPDLEAKMAAYRKTLGNADTLFRPTHLKADDLKTGEAEGGDLFGGPPPPKPLRTPPPPKPAPKPAAFNPYAPGASIPPPKPAPAKGGFFGWLKRLFSRK